MGANAWARLMDYCDGKEPYSGESLEHLRADIIAHNDMRLSKLATAQARIAKLEADNEELIQGGRRVIDTGGSRESFFYLRQILDDAAMEDDL